MKEQYLVGELEEKEAKVGRKIVIVEGLAGRECSETIGIICGGKWTIMEGE